jgi:hypothetical protein
LYRCPIEDLKVIYSRLGLPTGLPVPGLSEFLGPTFVPVSVRVHLLQDSYCSGISSASITGWKSPIPPTENFQPEIKNQIDDIRAVAGEFLVFKVPDNFCNDVEDGGTRQLNLTLLDQNNAEVTNETWLQFDKKNKEFYGLPPEVKLPGPRVEEWVLQCMDKGGM